MLPRLNMDRERRKNLLGAKISTMVHSKTHPEVCKRILLGNGENAKWTELKLISSEWDWCHTYQVLRCSSRQIDPWKSGVSVGPFLWNLIEFAQVSTQKNLSSIQAPLYKPWLSFLRTRLCSWVRQNQRWINF